MADYSFFPSTVAALKGTGSKKRVQYLQVGIKGDRGWVVDSIDFSQSHVGIFFCISCHWHISFLRHSD